MTSSAQNDLISQFEKLDVADSDRNRTGLVYDELMLKHVNAFDKQHPEVPGRISLTYQKHEDYGLLQRCKRIQSRAATEEELLCLHSQCHIDKMKETQNMSSRELFRRAEEYDSVYMSEHMYESALVSCGCTLAAVEEVVKGKVQNAVAIVRPPGHHADTDFCMGFCYFNNVAIAARHAQQTWNAKRVLIVDWDIHHGNGTQHLFDSDPSVLYFSMHRYDHGHFYPFSTYANYDSVGVGPGEGYSVNVPWNKRHVGDADYLAAFQYVLLPIAYEFNPDLVLVSAGFDSARGDPKGQCDVTPEGFCHLTNMLMCLANGKVVLVLEGGYNLTSVAESMSGCTSTLLGDPCPRLEDVSAVASLSAMQSVASVIKVHRKYWKTFAFADVLVNALVPNQNREEDEEKEGKKPEELKSLAQPSIGNGQVNNSVSNVEYDPGNSDEESH